MNEIDIGNKTIEITSSAGTPVAYERIFKEDVLNILMTLKDGDDVNEKAKIMDKLLPKLTFVMYSEAHMEPKELLALTEEDYICWLLTIPPKGITKNSGEIMRIYNGGQTVNTSPKNA